MTGNKGQITPQVNSRDLGYPIIKMFKTSLLLKLLRKNFLNGTPDRSQAEYKVAQALRTWRYSFFANSRCRIRNRLGKTETKEPDFVVFYKGSARILEVDGADYH